METAWISIAIAALTLVGAGLGATLRYLIKSVRHQTQIEDKLDNAIEDIARLVVDKDKVHTAIYEQMRVDRDATDKRLRYLEEFWISIGQKLFKGVKDGNIGD